MPGPALLVSCLATLVEVLPPSTSNVGSSNHTFPTTATLTRYFLHACHFRFLPRSTSRLTQRSNRAFRRLDVPDGTPFTSRVAQHGRHSFARSSQSRSRCTPMRWSLSRWPGVRRTGTGIIFSPGAFAGLPVFLGSAWSVKISPARQSPAGGRMRRCSLTS